ncbi:hypothetical protein HMPREF0591_0904 [Mycobacterium parascrofulaceum ATCC BAA-614]|uniref:Uncharacterized protein n=1 Tax=Mycobacterium parascrofulaceum ATCC BAA-614 TaxID=525368 RepID=D5P410_9MYCO|nr:hypothetical protein HMPREF0591_0904 [Mycobacterium parascrofulaceum ATCC BAA-614]
MADSVRKAFIAAGRRHRSVAFSRRFPAADLPVLACRSGRRCRTGAAGAAPTA